MPLSFDDLVLDPCVAAFGEAAQGNPVPTYAPAAGSSFVLDGVFDRGFTEIDQLTGPVVATATPKFGVRLSQFPAGVAPLQGDQVTIRGQAYLVREVRPDSHGHALLLLNEAS